MEDGGRGGDWGEEWGEEVGGGGRTVGEVGVGRCGVGARWGEVGGKGARVKGFNKNSKIVFSNKSFKSNKHVCVKAKKKQYLLMTNHPSSFSKSQKSAHKFPTPSNITKNNPHSENP